MLHVNHTVEWYVDMLSTKYVYFAVIMMSCETVIKQFTQTCISMSPI